MKYLKLFTNHSDYNIAKSSLDRPNVSHCVTENHIHYNPKTQADEYFTFVALEDGTFTFTGSTVNNVTNSLSYSIDNGITWIQLNSGVASPTITTGNKILWKGTCQPGSTYPNYGIGKFLSTGRFDVQGNIMSLLYEDNFKKQIDLTGKSNAFTNLFYQPYSNVKVINAKDLSLPALTLSNSCYSNMFQDCNQLVTAPELPSTTLTDWCYTQMFYGCTSLITAPELPATTLTPNCYSYMFTGCTSLVTAPELPATTLVRYCYSQMFYRCTSLITAPELPATTLVEHCYDSMFWGCTNLNYIKAMFTTTPGGTYTTYTTNWVKGVAANGTFVKNSAAQWDVSGVNGVPSGWTVQTASE